MTPEKAVLHLQQLSKKLKAEICKAEIATLHEGKQIAIKLSSGTLTSAQLRRMGHPYRIGGKPTQDAALINQHSGRFRSSWHHRTGNWSGDKLVSLIYNDAPYARYLDKGTRKMIARPIRAAILAKLQKPRWKRLQQAIQRGLQP